MTNSCSYLTVVLLTDSKNHAVLRGSFLGCWSWESGMFFLSLASGYLKAVT